MKRFFVDLVVAIIGGFVVCVFATFLFFLSYLLFKSPIIAMIHYVGFSIWETPYMYRRFKEMEEEDEQSS